MVGPDDRTIYTVQKETEGRFTFIAHESGVYRFCFSNAMSTVTPKTVSFTLVLGEGSRREQVAKSGPSCADLHLAFAAALQERMHLLLLILVHV